MNFDSIGAYGCKVKGTTPNIDRLAASSLCFDRAHVTVAVCQPCRNTLNSGRYPHRNIEGFQQMAKNKYPTLPHILKQNGYQVGILGKVGHSAPYKDFSWDMAFDSKDLGVGRNAQSYHQRAAQFIKNAKQKSKPFYLMFNTHDPHRPFHQRENKKFPNPSKIYSPKEVVVPGFLPDLPEVRREIAEYYSSVRRADDVIGKLLEELKTAGVEKNTVVMFLSDHRDRRPLCQDELLLPQHKNTLDGSLA